MTSAALIKKKRASCGEIEIYSVPADCSDSAHLTGVYYLTTVEWKDFLPGSFLSHLDYGSRNNDLSLVSGICIVAILSQWFSCLAQFHLRGRGWTNFSPLFNDWDDTGPPPTSTSRLWVIWDNYEWDLLGHREAVLSGLGTFLFHVVSWVSFWVVLVRFWLGCGLLFLCLRCFEDTWLFALTHSPTCGNCQSKTKRFDDRLSLERARHELKKRVLGCRWSHWWPWKLVQ